MAKSNILKMKKRTTMKKSMIETLGSFHSEISQTLKDIDNHVGEFCGANKDITKDDNEETKELKKEKAVKKYMDQLVSYVTSRKNPPLGGRKVAELFYRFKSLMRERNMQIAMIYYQINRECCAEIGLSLPSWEKASKLEHDNALTYVRSHLACDNAHDVHERWMIEQIEDGWVYGPVKDDKLKQDPFLVPFNELPVEQRTKEILTHALIYHELGA